MQSERNAAARHPVRSLGARLTRNKGVWAVTRGSTSYELNEVGVRIWDLCDGDHTLADIATALASEYAVSADDANADAAAFVSELLAHKIVEWIDD